MQWNDTTNRTGLIQDMEDICGLGATGITSNSSLFQQFTRWANDWYRKGANYAMLAYDGHDFDDPAYTTFPSGFFDGTTDRTYLLDGTYKMLKFRRLEATYDGVNYVHVLPFSLDDREKLAKNDPNVDQLFSELYPKYDPSSNGFDLYPKFTQAQVDSGAQVYVEWYRKPKEFATTGTDSQEPFLFGYDRLISKGASYEWARLYNPNLASSLAVDIFGNNGNIKGILKELEEWAGSLENSNVVITPKYTNNQ